MAYIKAEDLIKKIFPCDIVDKKCYSINAKAVYVAINETPAADVIPRDEVEKIFEEIEKLSYRFMNDKHYIFGDMVWDIAELKKKYIGEQKGGAE